MNIALIPHGRSFLFVADGDYYGDPQLIKMQGISDYGCLDPCNL